MKHYLVTLWNVDLYDLGWLQRRQKVFEKFTLRSVEGQEVKNFEWLFISDARTPDSFKNVLERYPARVHYHDFENYEWKYPKIKGLEEKMELAVRIETIPDVIGAAIGKQDTDYIITSRLDNDDIIAREHMRRIQSHAAEAWQTESARKFWLTLVRGFRLKEDKIYPFNSKASSFLSFVEDPENLETCYRSVHTLAANGERPLKIIRRGEPTWAEVIHGENVMNRVKRWKGERDAAPELGRFNL